MEPFWRANLLEATSKILQIHRNICAVLALNNRITSKLIGADPRQLFYKQ